MSKFISFANKYFLVLIFFLFSGVMIYFVSFTFISERNIAKQEKYNDLKIYSGLISNQISTWIDYSKLHSKEFASNKIAIETLKKIFISPGNTENYDVLEKLKNDFKSKYKTEEIIFIHPILLTEISYDTNSHKTHFDSKTLDYIKQSIVPQNENNINV